MKSYILLGCLLSATGSLHGIALDPNWATDKIQEYKKTAALLTDDNLALFYRFKALTDSARIIEDKLKTANSWDKDAVAAAFKAMEGEEITSSSWFFWTTKTPDKQRELWNAIRDLETTGATFKSFKKLRAAFDSNQNFRNDYSSEFGTDKPILKPMVQCIIEIYPNFGSEYPIFERITSRDETLEQVQSAYSKQIEQLEAFIKTQDAVNSLIKQLGEKTPNPRTLHTSMMTITSTLKQALPKIQEWYAGLPKSEQTTFAQNFTDTKNFYAQKSKSNTIPDLLKQQINFMLYSALEAAIKPENTNLDNVYYTFCAPERFYQTTAIKPADFITLINTYPTQKSKAVTSDKKAIGALSTSIIRAADVIALVVSGTQARQAIEYLETLPDSVIKTVEIARLNNQLFTADKVTELITQKPAKKEIPTTPPIVIKPPEVEEQKPEKIVETKKQEPKPTEITEQEAQEPETVPGTEGQEPQIPKEIIDAIIAELSKKNINTITTTTVTQEELPALWQLASTLKQLSVS